MWNKKAAVAAAAILLFAAGCGNAATGGKTGEPDTTGSSISAGGAETNAESSAAWSAVSGAESVAEAVEFMFEADDAPLVDEEPESGHYADFVSLAEYKNLDITAPNNTRIEDGMTVNIDYSGSINGVKFDGGTGTGYSLQIGSGTFIEGFEEQLKGHKKGDRVVVDATFPDSYAETSLSGKTAQFDVTINKVYNTLPNIALTQVVDDSAILKYPRSMYDEWLAAYTELYSSYSGGSPENLDDLLEKIDLSKDIFLGMVYASMKNDLVCRAIMDSEGIDMAGERYQELVDHIVTGYGFENAEEMLAAGSSQKDIDYVAENQLCCELIEENAK